VFRVTRECAWTDRETGERRTAREVAYGLTDLTRGQANASRLLPLNRGHWRIENSVFYVRDEAFGEDRSRVRRDSAPEVLAGLRNAALSLLRLAGSTNISASLRSCSWNLQHVRNLLGIVN
jgi:predicted transposase YbfD/YdcC